MLLKFKKVVRKGNKTIVLYRFNLENLDISKTCEMCKSIDNCHNRIIEKYILTLRDLCAQLKDPEARNIVYCSESALYHIKPYVIQEI